LISALLYMQLPKKNIYIQLWFTLEGKINIEVGPKTFSAFQRVL